MTEKKHDQLQETDLTRSWEKQLNALDGRLRATGRKVTVVESTDSMEFVASIPSGKRLPQSEIDSLRAQTKTDLETLMPLVNPENEEDAMRKETQIYSLEESGVTDAWEWVISLSSNDDASFSLRMDQVIWESADDGEGASHALDKFKSGAELFSFVQSFWDEDHGEGLSEDAWQEIEANIRGIDAGLADEVRHAVRVAFGHEVPAKSPEQEAIERCVAGATWASESRAGGGAMWAALADRKQMEQALGEFVKAHHGQYGRVPEGVHVVLGKSVTFANTGLLKTADGALSPDEVVAYQNLQSKMDEALVQMGAVIVPSKTNPVKM